jgi:hypothetical protein
VLVECHSAEGYLELVTADDSVVLRCHWPVDLEVDEWIDIQNRFAMAGYLRAVDDAMSTGSGEVKGVVGGFLRITSIVEGFAIEFSRPEGGWSASSLRLHVRRSFAELLPQRSTIGGADSAGRAGARQLAQA